MHPHDFDQPEILERLYQTKHGVFLLLRSHMVLDYEDVKPLSDADAIKWLEAHKADLDVVERAFGAFPEAGPAETRTTLRLPGNLRQWVAASAGAAGVSLSTHIMQLLERSESQAAQDHAQPGDPPSSRRGNRS